MPRNPARLYRALLSRAGDALSTPDDAATRSALYRLLRTPPERDPPELTAVLKELDLGRSYARNHLLSLGAWPDDVAREVEEGLPLRVGRRLARLSEEERNAVRVDARSDRDGTWGQRVARAIERRRVLAAAPAKTAPDGWLPPSETPDLSPAPPGEAWRFPVVAERERRAEALHAALVGAILARWAEPGDAVVDLTAGTGTVGLVAHARGLRCWSSDVTPGAPFVHRMDATDVRFGRGLTPGCAELVFLHPPTYYAWVRDRPAGSVEGREGYAALVAEMIVHAVPVVRPGGLLVVIGRPVREGGVVHTAIGELQRELEEAGTTLVGYHLGVDERGSEDWHVLVGRTARAAG